MELIIKQEFRDLIPPLTNEEYNQLEENIKTEGFRKHEAITIWKGIIVDGHHRYKICRENNINFNVVEKEFDSESDVVLWMINEQKGRRNLTDGWKWTLALKKKEILFREIFLTKNKSF